MTESRAQTEERPPEKKSELKVKKKSPQKSFFPEENMSAWKYYNYLMRFGKRKMTRTEWVIWKTKKDKEDLEKKGYVEERKPLLKNGMSSIEYAWRLKKDPHFVDTVARDEFSIDFNKNERWL